MQDSNKYCCEEHVDLAFDDFLVEQEIFPYMESIKDKKCIYCEEPAIYILKKQD